MYLKNKNGTENKNVVFEVGDNNLRDPLNARRRGGGTHNSKSLGLRSKRTIRCRACRVPGHNRLTCPLLREPNDGGRNAYGTPLSLAEEDMFFTDEDLNAA